MKKLGIVLVVLAVAAAALWVIPSTRDEIQWRLADHKNTTASYESYLKTWPQGRHAIEAAGLYDERGWADAQAANTPDGFKQYVVLHGAGKHVAEANDSLEGFKWREASQANTIAAYRAFAEALPQGKHAAEAQTKIAGLRADPALFTAAYQAGTEASLQKFLADYPGHEKEVVVQAALKEIVEGRDIVDLLNEKKIEIKSSGSGIESVNVSLRRKVPYSLTARIPVGTYFVSSNESAQNMVTTAEVRVRLETEEWQDISPDAACANRPLDIPSDEDSFSVRRSPFQAELAKLMPILAKAGVDVETRQAAVWIVTDDADYDDLGTLVASQFGFGGSRIINEIETTRAMKICEEAGINIKGKRIWGDKAMILEGLTDEDLKKWLRAKK